MFTHIKCQNCGTEYNGKTGKSNQTNILIYFVVTFAIAICACGGLAVLSLVLNNGY